MPNARILSEKKKVVEELTEKLKSQSGVFVDYSGINVVEDTAMRVKMRDAKIDYAVVKNTLMRFAIRNVGFEDLDPILNGTTSLAVSYDDPIAPARLIREYADKFNGFFEIKGGFMDGKVLSVSEIYKIAEIPPLPILHAQLLGTMLAPITSLAVVLKAIAEKNGAPAETAAPEPDQEQTAETVEEPVKEETTPVEEQTTDPVEEPTPVEEQTADTVEEPAKEETAPVEEQITDTVEEPAKEETTPVEEQTADTVEEPTKEETTPVEEQTADAAEDPAQQDPAPVETVTEETAESN